MTKTLEVLERLDTSLLLLRYKSSNNAHNNRSILVAVGSTPAASLSCSPGRTNAPLLPLLPLEPNRSISSNTINTEEEAATARSIVLTNIRSPSPYSFLNKVDVCSVMQLAFSSSFFAIRRMHCPKASTANVLPDPGAPRKSIPAMPSVRSRWYQAEIKVCNCESSPRTEVRRWLNIVSWSGCWCSCSCCSCNCSWLVDDVGNSMFDGIGSKGIKATTVSVVINTESVVRGWVSTMDRVSVWCPNHWT